MSDQATLAKQPETESSAPAKQPEAPKATTELNLRQIVKSLEEERNARKQLEENLNQLRTQKNKIESNDTDDDEDSSDPYVDRRKLKKELGKVAGRVKEDTSKEIKQAVQEAIAQERRTSYLKENSDFDTIMQPEMIQKFADKYPRLAEGILAMPEGFERQKLVYETMKSLGVHKKEEPSIQATIDNKRRSPYYQPGGVPNAPYANNGDFSEVGQKQAYEKMQQLKKNLRLG